MKNDKSNDAATQDPSELSFDDGLFKGDITTAGFIRLPVCDLNNAKAAWTQSDSNPDIMKKDNYPCNPSLGTSFCGTTEVIDQTSDASPSVEDCMGIIKNFAGTSGNYTTLVGRHETIASNGKCKFGVYSKAGQPNLTYFVGNQDIVDIIKESVKKFGGSGKVGTKGDFKCRGTGAGTNNVGWGLF